MIITTIKTRILKLLRSLEVEMLERGIMCLVRWALALVFPVAVIYCPGFPGCFPESRAVVVHHNLSVISSVGRAQRG